MPLPAADPAAILGAAQSLRTAAEKAAEINHTDLSAAYLGGDEFMRQCMRVATQFENWACAHVDFEQNDEVWPYHLEDKFGEAVLKILPESSLAQFNETHCPQIATLLSLSIRSDTDLEKSRIEFMQGVARCLRDRGLTCDVEHPGYIDIPMAGGHWCIGTTNPNWGGEFCHHDGRPCNFPAPISLAFPSDQVTNPHAVATAIFDSIRKQPVINDAYVHARCADAVQAEVRNMGIADDFTAEEIGNIADRLPDYIHERIHEAVAARPRDRFALLTSANNPKPIPESFCGIWDRQQQQSVLTLSPAYQQVVCLERSDTGLTALTAWLNRLTNPELASENLPITQPPFKIPA